MRKNEEATPAPRNDGAYEDAPGGYNANPTATIGGETAFHKTPIEA